MAAVHPTGLLAVAYRSGLDDLRDPALALSYDRGTSFSLDTVLAADGWRLAGCPVDGPALTLDHAGGGIFAWYTGAGGGGAWIAPWRANGGLMGIRRPLNDSLASARHPQLARLGSATLVAVEGRTQADQGRSVIAVRALEPDGALTPWLFLGANAAHAWTTPDGARSALVCWTEHGEDGDRVRVVRLTRSAR